MAASDLKRFTEHLRKSAPCESLSAKEGLVTVQAATDIDFDNLLELLNKYQDDATIQSVLVDSTHEALPQQLQHIQESLDAVETESIQSYMVESETLGSLHTQIQHCDKLLGGVEAQLGAFDRDLGAVNSQIRSLEALSSELGVRLRNRRAAADALGVWLEATTVPPDLVRAVAAGDPDVPRDYIPVLNDLRDKIQNMQAFPDHRDMQAYPTLMSLRDTAATRVRACLVERISAIRAGAGGATGNAVIRRQSLLNYRDHVAFLRAHAPELHAQVVAKYVEVDRTHLSTMVRAYMKGLGDVTRTSEHARLVAPGDSGAARLGSMMASVMPAGGKPDNTASEFALGTRAEELLHPDFALWPSAALQRAGSGRPGSPAATPSPEARRPRTYRPLLPFAMGRTKIGFEYSFKAHLHQLCDAAVGESVFLESFFGRDVATSVFDAAWKSAIEAVEAELEFQLSRYYDAVGVLVMVRVVRHCQLQMMHAGVAALDAFLERAEVRLWPLFSNLMREHIDAVTNDKANAKGKALRPRTPVVLPVTKRWTQLFISLGRLNAEYGDSQVNNNTQELLTAFVQLLFGIQHAHVDKPRAGLVFMLVNLQHAVDQCQAAAERPLRTQPSSLALPDGQRGLAGAAQSGLEYMSSTLDIVKEQYWQECLNGHVRDMHQYVLAAARAQAAPEWAAGQPLPGLGGVARAKKILMSFKGCWKDMIKIIPQEVQTDFEGSPNCRDLMLRICLDKLYQTYEKFLSLLSAQGPDFKAILGEGPALQTLRYELRNQV